MAYYLKSVNFIDQQSIKESDITELVKIGKYCVKIWNEYVPGYGNYNKPIEGVDNNMEMKYDCQGIIKICKEFFEKIKVDDIQYDSDKKDYEKYSKIFYEKYSDSSLEGKIFYKKIRIQQVDDSDVIKHLSKIFMKAMNNEHIILRYNPVHGYNSIEEDPWWIKAFEWDFPHHGGDEESYFLSSELENIELPYDERGWNIRTRWFVIMLQDRGYMFLSLGRSAHA
jgi:hypothetical protein